MADVQRGDDQGITAWEAHQPPADGALFGGAGNDGHGLVFVHFGVEKSNDRAINATEAFSRVGISGKNDLAKAPESLEGHEWEPWE